MKKLFLVLVCAVLFSATFVLSSYKTNDNNAPIEELTAMSDDCDGYTFVGIYTADPKAYFSIFQKEGMCNSYYWGANGNMYTTPDEVYCDCSQKGVLMKDSEGRWYAAVDGTKYYIDL